MALVDHWQRHSRPVCVEIAGLRVCSERGHPLRFIITEKAQPSQATELILNPSGQTARLVEHWARSSADVQSQAAAN